MSKLIGVSGFARSGKDTFYERSSAYLSFHGESCVKHSFASALKKELDPLLLEHAGISAFTEDDAEKEIIRPLLVTYGTDIRRKLNPDCWIEKINDVVDSDLSAGKYVFITDVRFLNEAKWVKDKGGLLFNISRDKIGPANKDEAIQSKLIKNLIDYKISWPTFTEPSITMCDDYIIKLFADPSSGLEYFPKNQDFIKMKG